MQHTPLNGKVALVTGSTSGIGLGIAHALAAQGAHIIFNGFGDQHEIDALPSRISKTYQVRASYHGANLARVDEIEAMMAYASDLFGGIDILVNNAGIQYVAAIADFPTHKWDEVIAVNLNAAFHTTRLALPYMRAQNWGRIINIASVHGLVASINKSAYIAAKHGLVGFTKVTALETATTGITCNAICPGWVLTPLVQAQVDARAAQEGLSDADMKRRMLMEKQPSGEFVTPEQLGGVAAFLCSEAASQIRGAALPVDGAYVTQ